MWDRVHAYALSSALLAAVFFPLLRGRDSFPLSTYPMFARKRDTVVEVQRALGVQGAARVVLPPQVVVGSFEVMQAVATLRQAFGRGAAASEALCRDVARRAAASPPLAGVTEVELVAERWDAVAYFASDARPLASRVRARCKVAR